MRDPCTDCPHAGPAACPGRVHASLCGRPEVHLHRLHPGGWLEPSGVAIAPTPPRPGTTPTPGLAARWQVQRLARACPYRSKVGAGCGKVRCHRPGTEGILPHSDCVACADRMLNRALPAPT